MTLDSRDGLSSDQSVVYDSIMDWIHSSNTSTARPYLRLGGLAGTGKSTIISILAQQLRGQFNIWCCAYTGKATSILKRKLMDAGVHVDCSTIHSLIYYPQVDGRGQVVGWERRPGPIEGWGLDPAQRDKNPLQNLDLIIVDEASMINNEIWTDLLSYQIPILAVGDHGQLPPISKDAINLMEDPDLTLEQIHRQAANNPILALAHQVRQGLNPKQFKSPDSRVRFAKGIGEGYTSKNPMDAAVICYRNRSRVNLNMVIREKFGRTGCPMTGDIVMCLRNAKPLFNGMRGVIVERDADDQYDVRTPMRINFPDDGFDVRKPVCRTQFCREKTYSYPGEVLIADEEGGQLRAQSWSQVGHLFDYGYAVTCHKAQGSQFKDVVVALYDIFGEEDLKKRWIYTACTRAEERLVLVG